MSVNRTDRTPAQIEYRGRRQAATARAKDLGLPMTGKTETILFLIEIMERHPRIWTQKELASISPYLAIHQDVKPGDSDARVGPIMRDGLRSGMVDDLDPMVSGKGWTWAKRLVGSNAFVFCRRNLRYKGQSAYLAEGNLPLFTFRSERGQPVLDALKTAVTREEILQQGDELSQDARYEQRHYG